MFYPGMLIGLPMLVIISVIMLLTPFGYLRFTPLLLVAVIAWRMRRTKPAVAALLGAWMFLAYAADLLAWWCSKEPIPAERATQMWGSWPSAYLAGFPLHRLELPPPPLGPGTNVGQQLAAMLPNLGFWLAVSGVVVLLVAAVMPRLRNTGALNWRVCVLLLAGAFLFNQVFLVTWMLWFD